MTEGMRVLIVDDSRTARLLSAATLRKVQADIQVFEAGDGTAALALLENEPVHAAIVDMNMPGMDGFALAGHIRERYPAMRIVMLSANVQDAVLRRAEEMQLQFFRKPMNEALMRQIVGTLQVAS